MVTDLINNDYKERRTMKKLLQVTIILVGLLFHCSLTAMQQCRITPLHEAANKGDKGAVAQLLGVGAQIEALDPLTETPLHVAAYKGESGVVRLLLAAGAHKEAKNFCGSTPLAAASLNGKAEVVLALLENNAFV